MLKNWAGILFAAGWVPVAMGEVEELYLDADDGGRHAVIGASLRSGEDGGHLQVRIRPHGLGVEAEGGWKSRAGFNAHTARELRSVLRAEGFEAKIRGAGRLERAEVEWKKSFGSFPRRTLRDDWSIDYFARTESLVSELSFRSTQALRGRGILELWARGEPRLLIEYDTEGEGVLGMKMPGHSTTIPVALLVAEQKEGKPLALPPGWRWLPKDGKWWWYDRLAGEDEEKQARFVAALKDRRDWRFLEEMALYVSGAYGTHSIGVVLHAGKAKNWRRVSAWFLRTGGGHGAVHTNSLLMAEGEKAETLAWLQKYADKLDPAMVAIRTALEQEGIQPAAEVDAEAPFEEDQVFAGIARAFKDREEPLSESELARIARGIRGWSTSQRWGSPWALKVVELIEDEDWRVAETACLAFTHGKNNAVPMGILWKVAEDEKKEQRLREAAFLGWSYGDWGEVFPTLHVVAGDPQHAAFMPAVSRLGELGNGWTIELLDEYSLLKGVKGKRNKLSAAQRKLVQQEIKVLGDRFGKQNVLSNDFETTAWSTVLGFHRSADMEDWFLRRYGTLEYATDETRKLIASVRGRNLPVAPKVRKERLAVRQRLTAELEFRWKEAAREK